MEFKSSLDIAKIREDFPVLKREVNGHPLVYLDNAATTQKPQAVIDALDNYYSQYNSNVHRGIHRLSQEATDAYEAAREKVRLFLGARDIKEVIFTRGVTEGINLVAFSFGEKFVSEGDEILITEMEHHSNIVPWQLMCERKGATLQVVPINERGELRMDKLEEMLTERTKLLSVVHVSNALGSVNPIGEIVEMAHAKGAKVLVDGAQAAPHLPIDVQALDCDFYAISSHKVFGPTGIGALYGKRELLEEMPPYQGGGDMIELVSFERTTWNELPYKFEAGTPNIADGIAFGAALDYFRKLDSKALVDYENELLTYATESISDLPGIRFIGTAENKASVLGFVVDGIHAHDLGAILDMEGVAVRVGHHCAQPVMRHFEIPGSVRASFAFYNSREDVDRFSAALHKAVEIHKGDDVAKDRDIFDTSAETIQETQQRIVDKFSSYDNWEERYQAIIDLGQQLPPVPEEVKQEKFIVRGCQSTVYLKAEMEGDRVMFKAGSNAMIVNGLIAILLQVYSNRTTDEVVNTPPEFIQKLGLSENLTQGRANGLAAMIEQIKLYAYALKMTRQSGR